MYLLSVSQTLYLVYSNVGQNTKFIFIFCLHTQKHSKPYQSKKISNDQDINHIKPTI